MSALLSYSEFSSLIHLKRASFRDVATHSVCHIDQFLQLDNSPGDLPRSLFPPPSTTQWVSLAGVDGSLSRNTWLLPKAVKSCCRR